MKFTIEKSDLVTALGRCLSVTDAKSTMPILGAFYIAAGKQLLTIGATDLYRGITAKVEATIDEQGSIALPAREFYDRIRSLPDGKVAFVAEGTKATLKTVGTQRRFTMHGVPGEEFPSIPKATGTDAKWQTTTHKLAGLIGAVAPAISTDASRPHLNCMMVQHSDDGVRAVATDGHVLNTVLHGTDPEGATKWLVPLAAVSDLRKLCDTKSDEEVTLQQDGRALFVRFEEFIFSTMLIDAQFPPWQMVVPKSFTRTVTLNRLAFIDSLRAVAISSSSMTGGVRFSFRKEALVLLAKNATDGEGFDELPFEEDIEPCEVGFNNKCVLDALTVLATEKVTFSLGKQSGSQGDHEQAGVVRVPGSEVYMGLIMPMAL